MMNPINITSRNTLLVLFIFSLSFDLSGQDNKGNPIPHFLFPSFKDGIVLMRDGKKFNALLNYNLIDEKMITELNGIYRYPKNPRLIDSIYLENRIFVPVGNAFYEVLSSGPVTFLLQNRSNYTPKGTDVGYGVQSRSVGNTQYKRFELSDVLYQSGEVVNIDLPQNVDITPSNVFWVRKNDNMENFTSNKQFQAIFTEYGPELKGFIKKEKINFKSREDVIRLGNYCNEIMLKKK